MGAASNINSSHRPLLPPNLSIYLSAFREHLPLRTGTRHGPPPFSSSTNRPSGTFYCHSIRPSTRQSSVLPNAHPPWLSRTMPRIPVVSSTILAHGRRATALTRPQSLSVCSRSFLRARFAHPPVLLEPCPLFVKSQVMPLQPSPSPVYCQPQMRILTSDQPAFVQSPLPPELPR